MTYVGRAFLVAWIVAGATSVHANYMDGSVFLFPIGSSMEFKSFGRAEYLNALNERIQAPIGGEHSVSGPQVFTTSFTKPYGLYDEFLEGPAAAEACYSTRLEAWAVGDFGLHKHEANWDGPETKCAPANSPPDDPPPLEACDHCSEGGMQNEPLILDLNGDGIWTTSKTESPVWFDLDGNGLPDLTGWTHPDHEEGFLYVDWNGNRKIDSGRELFGDATLLPDGTRASHGFQALGAYDEPEYGGNADGEITRRDRIWSKLRLWVDRNHDGSVTSLENYTLGDVGVTSISLDTEIYASDRDYGVDANGNLHFLQGSYLLRERGVIRQRLLHEVWFVVDLSW